MLFVSYDHVNYTSHNGNSFASTIWFNLNGIGILGSQQHQRGELELNVESKQTISITSIFEKPVVSWVSAECAKHRLVTRRQPVLISLQSDSIINVPILCRDLADFILKALQETSDEESREIR